MTDYWRYVKPDPCGLEDNPFINPKNDTPKDNHNSKSISPVAIGAIANVAADFITLENLICVDAKGNIIEKYDWLDVRKDVEREKDGSRTSFTPYDAIVHFEGQGLFLPSFALSCKILETLYDNRKDAEIAEVLEQYKDHGAGYGWHAQNTLVDWSAKKIIHYPLTADYGGKVGINSQKKMKSLKFANTDFSSVPLENALKKPNYKEFIQNLSGLEKPEKLVEIGVYFGKPAKSFVSSSGVTRAAWLGCDDNSFILYTNSNLDSSNAARGVRIAALGGATPKR